MRPQRTITFTTYIAPRVSHKEPRERFVIDTAPIWGARQPVLAPTASLLALEDDLRRGEPCPLCFIETGVNGDCGGCE